METAPRGVLTRGIVVAKFRVAYVPVQKAACTSLRWLFADLLEIPPESFEDPENFRATQGQTIQNVHRWPPQYVTQRADPGWLAEASEADDWLRFSVVRDPARRLWSAWQSKVLLRQPGFVQNFGDEPWFPDIPSSPEDVLESFERFLGAFGRRDGGEPPYNLHWALQTELLGDALPALGHVGRTEKMGETLGLLGEHLAQFDAELPTMRRENVTPLPYPAGLLSEDGVRAIREHYAPDYAAFGYAEPEANAAPEEEARAWRERTGTLLESARILISHNERFTKLNGMLQQTRNWVAKGDARSQRLRETVEKREEQLVRLRDTKAQLQRQLQAARERSETTSETLREMQESSSWRYTAPMRRVIGAAKRVRGRG